MFVRTSFLWKLDIKIEAIKAIPQTFRTFKFLIDFARRSQVSRGIKMSPSKIIFHRKWGRERNVRTYKKIGKFFCSTVYNTHIVTSCGSSFTVINSIENIRSNIYTPSARFECF